MPQIIFRFVQVFQTYAQLLNKAIVDDLVATLHM